MSQFTSWLLALLRRIFGPPTAPSDQTSDALDGTVSRAAAGSPGASPTGSPGASPTGSPDASPTGSPDASLVADVGGVDPGPPRPDTPSARPPDALPDPPELEPAPPTPPVPPQPTPLAGPFSALHATLEAFAEEVRGPRWADTQDGGPLRWARVRAELGDAAAARVRRLREAAESGAPARLDAWVRADLGPYLEHLCAHFSDATEAARSGDALGERLRARLESLLFQELDAATRQAALFTLQPVTLFVTEFDPEVHHASGGRAVPGAEGLVVRLVAPGRRDPSGRRLLMPAHVVVGK